MKLKTVKIKNFRGFKDEVIIPFENLTAFIGKNDAGKSTILEALEIFFNNKLVSCEHNDLNVKAKEEGEFKIEITCVFNELPNIFVLDSTYEEEDLLRKQYLLNADGDLEIKKIFDTELKTIKEKIFIVCNHPSADGLNDLLYVKNAELQKRAKNLRAEEDSLPFVASAPLREYLWSQCSDLQIVSTELPTEKEGSKDIFEKIKEQLPIFALFQSDRDNSDENKEVTDPMKLAVQEALKEVNQEIQTIKSRVRDYALHTAQATLSKLREMNPDIANELVPEFKLEPKFDNIFKLTINSDSGIPINKRGSGVRRLILLNFFRAEAEKRRANQNNPSIIYAFEEPETSQHPKHQELIIKSFMELADSENTQIILTTHTPNLAKFLPTESLRFVTTENTNRIIKSGNEVYKEIADSLGILPEQINTGTKCLFLVEGHYDVAIYNNISEKLKEGGYLPHSFKDLGIQIIFVGGCSTLNFWVTSSFAQSQNVPIVAYFDSDKTNATMQSKNHNKIQELENNRLITLGFCTQKRELENYLHPDIFKNWNNFIPDDVNISFGDYDDVKKIAGDFFNQIIRENVKPSKVLEKSWNKMTLDLLREREKYINNNGNEHFEFTENFIKIYELLRS